MFTKKDFLLLEDAINDGIKRFYETGTVRSGNYATTDGSTERNLRFALANSFADKLKYTSDGFDPAKFKRSVTDHEPETKKIKDSVTPPFVDTGVGH